jgi:sterol desaturase/sphingolipid hydroxylase (fatty acid hydroxylase superfamily)
MIGFLTNEWLMLWGTPITLILIVLEILITTLHHQPYYTKKDSLENVFLAVCNFLVDAASKALGFLLLGFIYLYHIQLAPNPQSVWLYWFSLLFVEDFTYWFMHFMDHKVRLLWAGHVHHHSSTEFNFSVGLGSAVFEPIEKFIFFMPLAFIGYRPIDIVLMYLITQGWGTFVHTRTIKKLGILEYLFTTPSHHRVHHGRNPKYLDKNFGMFLIIWDKLFGTFEPEDPNEEVEFGIVTQVAYKNYFDIIFYEIKQILKDVHQKISFKQKLLYIFGPPGYSHDGSRKTAKQLLQQIEDAKKPH